MAFNGAGTFNRIYNWVNDKNNGINITASRTDTEDDGFATGLSTCITKDGQTTISANIPMNTHKFTGLTTGSAATDSCTLGQAQTNTAGFVAAGGTADAITAAYSPALSSLTDGIILRVRAGAANATTTPTFSPSSLTAHTITKNGNQALVAGDIFGSGHELLLQYNLAGTRWELLNPAVNATTFLTSATAASTYAPLASPTFTGTPSLPTGSTAVTQTAGNSSTKLATTAFVTTAPTINQPNLVGTTTNDSAASGSVGEFVSSTVSSGSAVSLTSATSANVTSISLTAGDWDVWGSEVLTNTGAGSSNQEIAGISTTSATLPTPPVGYALLQGTVGSAGIVSLNIPTQRISIASTTTVYLVANVTFTGSFTAYGYINARRKR